VASIRHEIRGEPRPRRAFPSARRRFAFSEKVYIGIRTHLRMGLPAKGGLPTINGVISFDEIICTIYTPWDAGT
jgi:hypothetical protein